MINKVKLYINKDNMSINYDICPYICYPYISIIFVVFFCTSDLFKAFAHIEWAQFMPSQLHTEDIESVRSPKGETFFYSLSVINRKDRNMYVPIPNGM